MPKKYSVDAVVVKVKDWKSKEDAKFFTLFTQEKGRIEAVAFGLGKMKNDLGGSLQFFHLLNCELVEGDKIDTIRDAKIIHQFKKFQSDLDAIAYGSILCEVVSEIFPKEQPEPEVFDLILKAFETSEKRNVRVATLIAGFQIMEHSGMQLSFSTCTHCHKTLHGDEFFNINEGGGLCHDCAADLREVLPQTRIYRESTRILIENFLAFDWQDNSQLNIDSISLFHTEKLFRMYVESMVGFQMNSYKFLDLIKKIPSPSK